VAFNVILVSTPVNDLPTSLEAIGSVF